MRIGNTKAQVRASLGAPKKSKAGRNELGSFVQYAYAGASSGVGVGSDEAAVENISGLRYETVGASRSCHTGRLVGGPSSRTSR